LRYMADQDTSAQPWVSDEGGTGTRVPDVVDSYFKQLSEVLDDIDAAVETHVSVGTLPSAPFSELSLEQFLSAADDLVSRNAVLSENVADSERALHVVLKEVAQLTREQQALRAVLEVQDPIQESYDCEVQLVSDLLLEQRQLQAQRKQLLRAVQESIQADDGVEVSRCLDLVQQNECFRAALGVTDSSNSEDVAVGIGPMPRTGLESRHQSGLTWAFGSVPPPPPPLPPPAPPVCTVADIGRATEADVGFTDKGDTVEASAELPTGDASPSALYAMRAASHRASDSSTARSITPSKRKVGPATTSRIRSPGSSAAICRSDRDLGRGWLSARSSASDLSSQDTAIFRPPSRRMSPLQHM